MPRYKLRTLLIVSAIGPPVLAALVLLPPIYRMALLDLVTLVVLATAMLWLWGSWPSLTKWL
jgi:hypothetical protein